LVVGVVVVLGRVGQGVAFYSGNAIVNGGTREVTPQDSAGGIVLRNLLIAVEQIERAGGIEGFGEPPS
jgi:hypothetical protein